jgi:hypothetical protein
VWIAVRGPIARQHIGAIIHREATFRKAIGWNAVIPNTDFAYLRIGKVGGKCEADMRLNTRAVRWILSIGVVAALGYGLAGLLGQYPAAPTQLAAAKSRWAAGAIPHYRLIAQTGSPCRLDVEVRDEQVAQVLYEDPCSYPARTVTGLFNLVERATSPLYTCAPPSCACQNVVTVYAIYDDQLGYPRKVAVRAERETNWRSRAFWTYLWAAQQLPDCVWASNADIINILAVTPLR